MLLFVLSSFPALRAASLSLHMPVFMCVHISLPSRSNFYKHSAKYINQKYPYPNRMSLTDQGQMPRVKEEPENPSLLIFYKPEREVAALLCHPQYILLPDIEAHLPQW